jgi:hypothetical protein
MRSALKEKGYDGAYSSIDTATGLVIFDVKNIKQVPDDSKWQDYINNIKYSKRLDTPFDKELRKAEGKAEVAPPEEDTITIGGKKGDKKTISSVARAMSKIMGLGKISKMNDREIVIGKTGVEIQPSYYSTQDSVHPLRAVFQPQSYQ